MLLLARGDQCLELGRNFLRHHRRGAVDIPADAELHVAEPHLRLRTYRIWIRPQVHAVDPRSIRGSEIVDEQLPVLEEELGMASRQRGIGIRELTRARIAARENARGDAFQLRLPSTQLQADRHGTTLSERGACYASAVSETSSPAMPGVIPKPPGTREFTPRAVIAGIVVAAIMGASYPYVVLKLGLRPTVSVVAAFFGYLFLGILFRNFNRWENNIVQTAGTSAAQTAFMCVILAAFDFVAQNPKLHYAFAPTPFQAFLWLTAASILGILLAVPLRRHYVVDEQLTYADGVAAAETIIVLDSRGPAARQGALALGLGLLASAAVWFFTQKWGGRL